MKRLAIAVILAVAATMALAPSVASARTSPIHVVSPIGVVSPIHVVSPIGVVGPIHSKPLPAQPASWRVMWRTRQHSSPVSLVAPMPSLERVSALRLSPQKLAILRISIKAR